MIQIYLIFSKSKVDRAHKNIGENIIINLKEKPKIYFIGRICRKSDQ